MQERTKTPMTKEELAWLNLGLPRGFPGGARVTEEARRALQEEWRDLVVLAKKVAHGLLELGRQGAPIDKVTLDVTQDPELPDWRQLVFTVQLAASLEETVGWRREVGRLHVRVANRLSAKQRELLAEHISIDLTPVT